ncbi:hypothetical protein ACFPN0_15445 [Kitasatospora cinereorecta]
MRARTPTTGTPPTVREDERERLAVHAAGRRLTEPGPRPIVSGGDHTRTHD